MWWKLRLILASPYFWLSAFLVVSFISVFRAPFPMAAFFSFAAMAIFVALGLGLSLLIRRRKISLETIFAILAILAVLNSLIAISQFSLQSDLGLQKFGESPLGRDISGVAKIEVGSLAGGQKFIRAYGLFPHPNILAAFLIVGLLGFYYFWFKDNPNNLKIIRITRTVIFLAGIFFVLEGLVLTFSRSGWLAAFLSAATVIAYNLFFGNRRRAIWLAFILLAISALMFVFLQTFIISRFTASMDEPAVILRSTYNKMGWEIIKENPLGVGIGNQIFYSDATSQYAKFGLTEDWQKQPIHNLYLLAASETGILGLATLVIFMSVLFRRAIKKYPNYGNAQNLENFIVIATLASLLFLGFFDHYLWDIWHGQLLLWLVVGILLARPRSTTDRAHPSEG